MIRTIKAYSLDGANFGIPKNKVKVILLSIFPVIFAQVIQRFYPVVDNHFVSFLGNQALLIHNIQFSFIYLGQYIGGATATSCLVFLNRSECLFNQKSIFYFHLILCVTISLFCLCLGLFYVNDIITHFSVAEKFRLLAIDYLRLGLVNMALQSVYLALIGVIIAVGKEKITLIFSFFLLLFNLIADYLSVHFLFSGSVTYKSVFYPMMSIGLSTSVLNAVGVIALLVIISREIKGWGTPKFKEILKVWFNELGGAFVSGVYPIFYAFQLGAIITSGSLLVTYQLLMQITAVFCIPLLATMQVALKNASKEVEKKPYKLRVIPGWLKELVYFGFVPTQILLIIFLAIPLVFFRFFFHYRVPYQHISYIVIFLIASMIGQIGNALTVPMRARKNSHHVTIGYFISDVVVLLGGMQLMIFLNIATPTMAGVVMLIYTIVYTVINTYFVKK